jgi:hypothetical protein
MVLKVAPPLLVSDEPVDGFVVAVHEVAKRVHSGPRHSALRGARFAHEETTIQLQFLTRA